VACHTCPFCPEEYGCEHLNDTQWTDVTGFPGTASAGDLIDAKDYRGNIKKAWGAYSGARRSDLPERVVADLLQAPYLKAVHEFGGKLHSRARKGDARPRAFVRSRLKGEGLTGRARPSTP
jgi:hypothetical protein